MKKQLLLLSACFMGMHLCAQNTFPTTGNVGVGTASPQYLLQVAGDARVEGQVLLNGGALYSDANNMALFTDGGYIFGNRNNSVTRVEMTADKRLLLYNGAGFTVQLHAAGNTYFNGGNVGIGTTQPAEKLSVNGTVLAKKIRVTQTGWADYVFDPAYPLRPLEEVADFIRQHRHLPGMAPAAAIEQQGLDLGAIVQQQQEKIEELTLYLLQEKRLREAQDQRLQALEKRLSSLHNQP